MKSLDAPIPGQSLTREPRNAPWERPPETADPEVAIEKHIQRIGDTKVLNAILDYVDLGLPVSFITEMMLTGGVTNGVHSIDISMMIAPVLHDYIIEVLEGEGVEFKEFFEEDGEEDIRKQMAVGKAIRAIRGKSADTEEEPEEEEIEGDMETDEEEMPQESLMARPTKGEEV